MANNNTVEQDGIMFTPKPGVTIVNIEDGHKRASWNRCDIYIETDEDCYYIEMKDPLNPSIPEDKQTRSYENAVKFLSSNEVAEAIDEKIKMTICYKYFESSLSVGLRINMILLAGIKQDPALALAIQQKVDQSTFFSKSKNQEPLVSCGSIAIVRLDEWDKYLGYLATIERVSIGN